MWALVGLRISFFLRGFKCGPRPKDFVYFSCATRIFKIFYKRVAFFLGLKVSFFIVANLGASWAERLGVFSRLEDAAPGLRIWHMFCARA